MMSKLSFAVCTRFAMAIMLGLSQPVPSHARLSEYQKLDYGEDACPEGLEILTESECSEAIAALGITNGGPPWTGRRTTMPRGCTLQKATDSMVFNTSEVGSGRHDLAPVCKFTGTPEPTAPEPTTPQPTPIDGTPKYQRFPYYWPHCPDGFDITTPEECSEAIAYIGVKNGGTPWTGSRKTMPRFCSLQKNTDSTIFNTDPTGDQRRHDLAPVCKWTGEKAPPDFFRVSREKVTEWRGVEHTITVKPEEWDYFLAFQESRKNGFSCPCNPGSECNEIKAPNEHWHPPHPEKATFDCTLWIAAWLHAEDQCIQDYFSHNSRDGFSPRMRCEAVGAVYKGEHQAGWHATGPGALGGLQTSPGHCNSMFNPSYLGFAVAHGARRNDSRGNKDVWTVLYNYGDGDISDSESCIPAGYTPTGERKTEPTGDPTLSMAPSSSPSVDLSTDSPTQNVCLGLSQKKCKINKDQCVYTKKKMVKQCMAKKEQFESDCSRATSEKGCKTIKVSEKKICKWSKIVNPCFKCHPVSKCT